MPYFIHDTNFEGPTDAFTAPCDAYLRGDCNLGSKCQLSHRIEDLLNSTIIDGTGSDIPVDFEAGFVHDNNHADIRDIQGLPTFNEVESGLPPYLPAFNPKSWHEEGMPGLIDRQFRLYRASQTHELIQRLRIGLQRLHENPPTTTDPLCDRWPAFENAIVEEVKHRPTDGFVARISFAQLRQLPTSAQRKIFWESSKHMKWMNPVVLLTKDRLIFCRVIVGAPRPKCPIFISNGLFKRPDRAVLNFQVVSPDSKSIEDLLHLNIWLKGAGSCVLIDLAGIVLPALLPTLDALKSMLEPGTLPFRNLLGPQKFASVGSTNGAMHQKISVPAYATSPGFGFDLSPICKTETTLDLKPQASSSKLPKQLSAISLLDQSQAKTVQEVLSREFALLQGPPGTGKSFVGVALIKILASMPREVDIGPIICVCCTNHALDQLLEHLLDAGIKNILRVGTRSKSERLENLNFQKKKKKNQGEQKDRYRDLQASVSGHARSFNMLFEKHRVLGSAEKVRLYLDYSNEDHAMQLFGRYSASGFSERIAADQISRWLRGGLKAGSTAPIRRAVDLQKANINSLSREEREALHQSWLDGFTKDGMVKITPHLNRLVSLGEDLTEIRREIYRRVFGRHSVLGFTTTGLSIHRKALEKLGSKILVCEEAGEVVEAQLLTSLLPSIQHAILIGDHLQLCPRVEYHMSRESIGGRDIKFDMSLFERLVIDQHSGGSNLPFSTLQVQRRMHPDIAELVKSTLYSRLQSSPPAMVQKPIVGVRDRLFWFDHRNKELKGGEGLNASASNDFEVEMAAKLTQHIINQRQFSPSDIAIITPYNSQLAKIRSRLLTYRIQVANPNAQLDILGRERMANIGSGVRIATVDDFQGEESKVVILSLVRSNSNRSCGFVGIDNRINVMLSRAQCAMYIFGNTETFRHVRMWRTVMDILKRRNRIGTELKLNHGNRPGTEFTVQRPEHF